MWNNYVFGKHLSVVALCVVCIQSFIGKLFIGASNYTAVYKMTGWIRKQFLKRGMETVETYFPPPEMAWKDKKQGETWKILHLDWKSHLLTAKYKYIKQSWCATLKSTIFFPYHKLLAHSETQIVIQSFSMPYYLDSFTDIHAHCASVLVFFFHIISYHKNYYSRVRTPYIFPEVFIVVIS